MERMARRVGVWCGKEVDENEDGEGVGLGEGIHTTNIWMSRHTTSLSPYPPPPHPGRALLLLTHLDAIKPFIAKKYVKAWIGKVTRELDITAQQQGEGPLHAIEHPFKLHVEGGVGDVGGFHVGAVAGGVVAVGNVVVVGRLYDSGGCDSGRV